MNVKTKNQKPKTKNENAQLSLEIWVATEPVCFRHSREGIDEGFDQHADRSAIDPCLQTRARPARGNSVSFVLSSVTVTRSQYLLVGGSPTATHFLCFAKESKQRKATTLPLAFGFPIVQVKKWESFETRFAQTTKLS